MIILSLVLPAHNEALRLEAAVIATKKALRGVPSEILIAEDGSSDGTATVAKKLAKKYAGVRAFSFKKRLGRGKALCHAFAKARGKYVGYMDVDLATDPSALKDAVHALEKCDVVTGSRYLPQSKSSRTPDRDFLSRGYNLLARLLLGSKINDHQCGFKFFRKAAALELCKAAKAEHWFWDTEALVLAQKKGLCVEEIPVSWKEKVKGSNVRVLSDSLRMGLQILELWMRLRGK